MGNYLDRPNVDKLSGCRKLGPLLVGHSSMQGWRTTHEDALRVDAVDGASELFWFNVCDGHAGSRAAEFSAGNLLDELKAQGEFKLEKTSNNLGRALKNAFMTLDGRLYDHLEEKDKDDVSGTTCIAAIVSSSFIVVANAGDCRAILAREGGVVALSQDHKPYDEKELNRIEGAGGFVRGGRVNGDLAVSRALGDFQFKMAKTLPAESQQVTACPDVRIESRKDGDEFLVLACDGVWDVMDNNEVASTVRELLQRGEEDIGLICEEILDRCLGLGSRDNMSIIIVVFPNAARGSGDGVRGLRKERNQKGGARSSTSK